MSYYRVVVSCEHDSCLSSLLMARPRCEMRRKGTVTERMTARDGACIQAQHHGTVASRAVTTLRTPLRKLHKRGMSRNRIQAFEVYQSL